MTSQHVELAFARTKELLVEIWTVIPPEMMSPALFQEVFNAFLHCDDDAQPKNEKAKGASA